MHCVPGHHTAKRRRNCTTQNTFLPVTVPHIHNLKEKFTGRLSYKPVLICLLIISPYLKYVITLPCTLSLITTTVCYCRSFPTLMFQKVAMHTKCGEIFNKHVAANILENLTVKKIQNWLRINRVTATSLVSPFLEHSVHYMQLKKIGNL